MAVAASLFTISASSTQLLVSTGSLSLHAFSASIPSLTKVLELSLQEIPRKWVSRSKGGCLQQLVEPLLYTPLRESLPRHVILTFILVGLTAAVGLSNGNLELVLGIEVKVAHD